MLACAGSAHPQARAPRPDTARLTQLLKAPRLAQGTEVWVLGVARRCSQLCPPQENKVRLSARRFDVKLFPRTGKTMIFVAAHKACRRLFARNRETRFALALETQQSVARASQKTKILSPLADHNSVVPAQQKNCDVLTACKACRELFLRRTKKQYFLVAWKPYRQLCQQINR